MPSIEVARSTFTLYADLTCAQFKSRRLCSRPGGGSASAGGGGSAAAEGEGAEQRQSKQARSDGDNFMVPVCRYLRTE